MKIEVEIVAADRRRRFPWTKWGFGFAQKQRESGEGDKGDGYFHGERMIAIDDRPGKTECDRCRSAGYERKALTTGHTGSTGVRVLLSRRAGDRRTRSGRHPCRGVEMDIQSRTTG